MKGLGRFLKMGFHVLSSTSLRGVPLALVGLGCAFLWCFWRLLEDMLGFRYYRDGIWLSFGKVEHIWLLETNETGVEDSG